MIQIVVLVAILLLAYGAGRTILSFLNIHPSSPLESWAYSTPAGLGVIAYVVLALGLTGLLTAPAVASSLLLLALASGRGFRAIAGDIGKGRKEPPLPAKLQWIPDEDFESAISPVAQTTHRKPAWSNRLNAWLGGSILAVAAVIVTINCFVPPSAHEWDALSYHLAAPKIYLAHHRIVFLPTDHHSNFPFTLEMLFTLGLLFGGYALANLLHFACGVMCVAASFCMGRRFGRGAGMIAAVTFATAPIVIWEAGAAYIEMGLALYVLTSAGAAIQFRRTGEPGWLALTGILMGFALSVKALALVPFALLGLLLWRTGNPIRRLAPYFLWAIVVGSPFYVKSWIQTGNPVYPFAYRLFGGRYWNTQLADAYAGEQRSFGQSAERVGVADDVEGKHPRYMPPGFGARLVNLIQAPFDLIAVPRLFYNYNDPGVRSQMGFLWLGLAPLPLLTNRRSRAAKLCFALPMLWFVVWSQTMQYVRYLIPLIPFLALAGAEAANRLILRRRGFRCILTAAMMVQAVMVFPFFLKSLPGQWDAATDPEEREKRLSREVNVYDSCQWINRIAGPNEGVVLFEETRGFWLDRPYLWGNSPHSLYIRYDTFKDGRAMADWFLNQGYRYALLNLRFAPQATQSREGQSAVRQAIVEGTVPDLTLRWYTPELTGEVWRSLLGEALRSGAAVARADASFNGAVVIEFRRRVEGSNAAPQA